ncbi:hypothetical protein DSO57_1037587 [Entomophthora muscae]|uniref:Uncharacterized protein n=1 Tax=Entomophthora muscae TaxID=34485 RepID=A0ACC2TXL1_9FUNG|nr:hypothetical protein DSO57_1037587 [Entomophthora muscae]
MSPASSTQNTSRKFPALLRKDPPKNYVLFSPPTLVSITSSYQGVINKEEGGGFIWGLFT